MTATVNRDIIYGPRSDFKADPRGIGWLYYESLKKNVGKIAQIDAESGVKDHYEDLLERCVRTAIEMKKRGITSKDMITICSNNHLNSCVPFIAGLFLNCKVSCLDPILPVSDTRHLIKQVEPTMVFVSAGSECLIEQALHGVSFETKIITFGNDGRHESFINFLRKDEEEEMAFQPSIPKNVKDTNLILFSSGSTGLPKGISLNHYILNFQMDLVTSAALPPEGFSVISFASLYWISTVLILSASINFGQTRIIVPSFKTNLAWDAIHIYKPAICFAAPIQILELLRNGIPPEKDVSSLKLFACGGGPLNKDQIEYVKTCIPDAIVVQSYGMTETGGGITMFNTATEIDRELYSKKPDSCGKPIKGYQYKIVDLETDEILGPNQKGELRVKTEVIMNGYYNKDCSEAFDKDGWLKTGDVMYFDEDECFFHVDRIKEMFKYKSWHVIPAKIETIISNHPGVANVIVVGLPHPEDGDFPCAVVVLKEGSDVKAEEIRAFAEAQLGDFQKLRGGVKIVGSLPLTPSGKINRLRVRYSVLNGKI